MHTPCRFRLRSVLEVSNCACNYFSTSRHVGDIQYEIPKRRNWTPSRFKSLAHFQPCASPHGNFVTRHKTAGAQTSTIGQGKVSSPKIISSLSSPKIWKPNSRSSSQPTPQWHTRIRDIALQHTHTHTHTQTNKHKHRHSGEWSIHYLVLARHDDGEKKNQEARAVILLVNYNVGVLKSCIGRSPGWNSHSSLSELATFGIFEFFQ